MAGLCRWRGRGHPPYDGPAKRRQAYEGTDRQLRGRVLALARAADRPVREEILLGVGEADRVARLLAAVPSAVARCPC